MEIITQEDLEWEDGAEGWLDDLEADEDLSLLYALDAGFLSDFSLPANSQIIAMLDWITEVRGMNNLFPSSLKPEYLLFLKYLQSLH